MNVIRLCLSGLHRYLFCAALMVSFFAVSVFSKDVRVTVQADESHVFRGFGGNAVEQYFAVQQATHVSEAVRDSMAKMVWGDLDFRVLRIWPKFGDTVNVATAENFSAALAPLIDAARAHQDSLILLLAPYNWGSIDTNNTLVYTVKVAQFIKDLRDNHDIRIDVTGVENEPRAVGVPDRFLPGMIKDLRRELDNRGLEDVKLIAPEQSNVYWDLRMDEPILSDPEAVAALDGWGFHSYSMSMTKASLDAVRSRYGLQEIWQTESGCEHRASEPVNDSAWSATAAGLFLGDVNLGANYWLWFLPYARIRDWSTDSTSRIGGGIRMMGYSVDGANRLLVLPKYYYFKQLSRAFRVGTSMRLCVSDLGTANFLKYMEGTFGNRPHIHAAAGIRPDGKWTVSAVNVSGVPNRFYVDREGVAHPTMSFPAEETVSATFFIEELADAGTFTFAIERTNGTVKNSDAGTATMVNGEVTVSVRSCELVSLVSNETVVGVAHGIPRTVPDTRSVRAFPSGKGHTIVFPDSENNRVGIWDTHGRFVRTLSSDKREGAVSHEVFWDGCASDGVPVARGLYVVRCISGLGKGITLSVMR